VIRKQASFIEDRSESERSFCLLQINLSPDSRRVFLSTYRKQQRTCDMTSRGDVECTCQRRRHRQRKLNEDVVGGRDKHILGGRDAPANYRHSRHLTAVTAGGEQRPVRTAADTRVCSSELPTSRTDDVETDNDHIAPALRSEHSRFDDDVEGRLHGWFIRQTITARHDTDAMTAVSCRRRCRQRRYRFQHVNTSTLHHVSRTGARRRVVRRWLTVSRRCSVVVDGRKTTDVTSGDDVTIASATDGESRSSRLDRAFLADDRSDDVGSVTKWRPDLSAIAVTAMLPRHQDAAAERTRVEDRSRKHDNVAQSTDSHCIAQPLSLPTTACDVVSSVIVLRYDIT